MLQQIRDRRTEHQGEMQRMELRSQAESQAMEAAMRDLSTRVDASTGRGAVDPRTRVVDSPVQPLNLSRPTNPQRVVGVPVADKDVGRPTEAATKDEACPVDLSRAGTAGPLRVGVMSEPREVPEVTHAGPEEEALPLKRLRKDKTTAAKAKEFLKEIGYVAATKGNFLSARRVGAHV